MELAGAVASDHQLARLLQIGMVLEEVVEARAQRHLETLAGEPDERVAALLADAAAESHEHRDRLEGLLTSLEADPVAFEDIERLVRERYARTEPEDFDDLLYDQLCNEETAYKFYDDVIAAIEASDVTYGVDRGEVLALLRSIREEEAEGVEEVARLMEDLP